MRTVFRNELTACLTLVAPVGMDETARRDWFAVAWQTLKHIPPDILAIGARKAREQCDHPSKIVPVIIAETEEMLRWRRETRDAQPMLACPPIKRDLMDRRGEPMSEEDTAELNAILEKLGAAARYLPDGSRILSPGSKPLVETPESGSIAQQREPDQRQPTVITHQP